MAVSPMMQQYLDAKAVCGDALLFFRMGDFYELFHEDARAAARVLNLTLTSREKGENAVPMAGFPHHQLESYLGKLIALGFRAGICEQVEDPKLAKGLVRREVTRIVSPGTVTDDALLDPRSSNYLAAVFDGEPMGLAWVELSTGRFLAACVPRARLADELARVAPVELLVSEEQPQIVSPEASGERCMVTRRPAWAFAPQGAGERLAKHFGVHSLEGFGFTDGDAPAIAAGGALLDYLVETQKTSLDHIDGLTRYAAGDALEIDESTRRSLEITRTMREGRREGSLLGVLDRTATAMGSRMLSEWIANPLTAREAIDDRLDAVGELVAEAALWGELRDMLRGVYDLERLLARVTTGRASPRDLSFVGRTLRSLPQLKAKVTCRRSRLLARLERQIDLCPEIRASLEAALVDDCPLVATDGGFIRPGFDSRLDELRELAAGGKQWIARYQAEEAQRSGIANLKIGFNKVFGYYLEITNVHGAKVPQHYIRKQTVKNAERYITPELKEYEEKVLAADDEAKQLEHDLFIKLRASVAGHTRRLQSTAAALAQLDVLVSLAGLARERGYCRPTVVDDSILEIDEGRHPVLDAVLPAGSFVPNDARFGRLGASSKREVGHRDGANGSPAVDSQTLDSQTLDWGTTLLVTGPNMAGKSTFIRQVALITLMTQVGSFVPAKAARVGICDRIFARVGASDELARGQSTFMVEMTETARILRLATGRSLVILDEIGRGTSTYDGLSLAWAVTEYLHDEVGCRTLFATHYHELTALAQELSGLRNFNVAVREWQDQVIFLHKIAPGAADKSYGIHVARLAGVPGGVIERAKQLLAQLENQSVDAEGHARLARRGRTRRAGDLQLTLFGKDEHPVLKELRGLRLNETTPEEALAWLRQRQARVGKD